MNPRTIETRLMTSARRIQVSSGTFFTVRGFIELMSDAGYKQLPERGLNLAEAITSLLSQGKLIRRVSIQGEPMFAFRTGGF